jgi:hypothetical protein
MVGEGDEDEELARALAMSRGEDVAMAAAEGVVDEEELDEEEQIRRAIEMSVRDQGGKGAQQGGEQNK